MVWTHIYDLILKSITLFLFIITLSQIPYLEDHSVFVILLGVVLSFVLYYFFVRTLATYLYCRLTLKMRVDLTQAKQLNDAFTPIFSFDNNWLPMKELKHIDDNDKYQLAIDTYEKWAEERTQIRDQQMQDFKNAGLGTKIMAIIIGYLVIASFMNLPPANYVAEAYCKLFNTDEYYPFLNCAILVLPTFLLFKVFGIKVE